MTLNFLATTVALALMLSSGSHAGAADLSTDKPQIQGANLRIEFDHNLRSQDTLFIQKPYPLSALPESVGKCLGI